MTMDTGRSRTGLIGRVSLCAAGAAVLLLVGGLSPAEAVAPGPVVALDAPAVGQGHISVGGDWAAWVASNQRIYVCDLRTNQVREVAEASPGTLQPIVGGGYVVWHAEDEQGVQIYLYGCAEERVTKLTSGPGENWGPEISRGKIVWRFHVKGGSTTLFLHDLATGTTTAIAEDYDLYSYSTDGIYVAYALGQDANREIYLYDCATGQTTQVTTNDYPDWTPVVKDGVVAWAANPPDAEKDDIFAYRIDSGITTRLTSDEFEKYHVRVDGGRVAWVSYTQRGSEIYLWDSTTAATIRVTRSPLWDVEPCLDGDWISWAGQLVPDLADIYLCYLPTMETLRVSSDKNHEELPQLSDGRLLWTRARWAEELPSQVMLCAFSPDTPPQPDPGAFPDAATSPYKDAIRAMVETGAVTGFDDGLFRPESIINRAQFAKMLVLLLDIPVSENLNGPFWDLGMDDPDDFYPHEYVAAAYKSKIVQGLGPHSYGPWTPISRAQLVTMIVRAADARGIPLERYPPSSFHPTLGAFDPTHVRAMSRAEYDGILSGLVDFGPNWDPWAPVTRAEAASMLWYLFADSRLPQ
jgi:Tol biopolymer transport system component